MKFHPAFISHAPLHFRTQWSGVTTLSSNNCQLDSVHAARRAVSTSSNVGRNTTIIKASMRPYLETLVERRDLTSEQMRAAIDYSVAGGATDAEIAALLALLAAKGETAEEITGVVSALHARMVPVTYNDGAVLDIVGTGGDRANTVNISTAASIVAAAAGCRVGKHGNRSVSSKSGSADVLQALGIELSITPEGVQKCIEQAGIGFMFAPNHHPSLKRIGPIRNEMKIRTVFNIVGPFLNPCSSKYSVIGVFKPELLEIAADVLIASGVKKAVVVHTAGLDEFSNTGVASIVEINEGQKESRSFDAEKELGMPRATVEDLRGGDADFNAAIIRDVLAGKRKDAITDAIALNAAAGCWVFGLDSSISDGLERVRGVLESGVAVETLKKWSSSSKAANKVLI